MRFRTDFRTSPPKVYKRGKKGTYHFAQWIDGKNVRRSLRTNKKREAEALAYKIWYSQQNKELQELFDFSVEISLVWTLHIESEKFKLLAASTKRTREHNFQAFKSWCDENKIYYTNDLSRNTVKYYLDQHEGANKTYNNILNDLKQTFRQISENMRIKNPFDDIEQKSITRGEGAAVDYRAFTAKEISQIFKFLEGSKLKNKEEWTTACHIALNTGLRFKDIAFLQWAHIVENKFIELQPHKTRSGGKTVSIKISPHLRRILADIQKRDFYILPGIARSYSYKSTKAFMNLLNRQHFPGKVGFHSFRSTFITWCSEEGVDLEALGGVVGHASKNQTEHYNKAARTIDLSFIESKLTYTN